MFEPSYPACDSWSSQPLSACLKPKGRDRLLPYESWWTVSWLGCGSVSTIDSVCTAKMFCFCISRDQIQSFRHMFGNLVLVAIALLVFVLTCFRFAPGEFQIFFVRGACSSVRTLFNYCMICRGNFARFRLNRVRWNHTCIDMCIVFVSFWCPLHATHILAPNTHVEWPAWHSS